MISMSQVYSIRQLRKQGETVAEIARKAGVCRNTVYNCLAQDDLSPKMPTVKERASTSDAAPKAVPVMGPTTKVTAPAAMVVMLTASV